jgi:pimeloyl-ACP methyl ester carboxylesterase
MSLVMIRLILTLLFAFASAWATQAQELVSFPSADGGIVFGDLYGSGSRGVILAPGARYDKSSWELQAQVIGDAGFRVLAIDFRGRGESQEGEEGADALWLDVLAAATYLRETGAETVAVVGASLGGWAAGEAVLNSEPGEIDRVVFLAHAPIGHPDRLDVPKLFIVSRGDRTGTGVLRLAAIREQYDLAPDPKELVVLEGSAHAQLLFQTEEGDRLMSEILRFLSTP